MKDEDIIRQIKNGNHLSFKEFKRADVLIKELATGLNNRFGDVSKFITQNHFSDGDTEKAEKIAHKLGYNQFAYTSTSGLIGLFVWADAEQYKRGKTNGCIIKSSEFGFMLVQDLEDLRIEGV